MNKNIVKRALAIVLCASMLSLPSCIGSFSLTNRLLGWNQNVGNKFLNELVFFAFWVLPVYEVTGLADLLVLNSIEFWSGENPMAKGEKVVDGNDGKYLVRCDGKGYDVVSMNDGSSVRLDFDAESRTWSYNAGGESVDIFTFVDDSHIKLPVNGGESYEVFELSQAGTYAYSQVAAAANLAAN